MESSGTYSFSMMKKAVILILVFIVSFLCGYSLKFMISRIKNTKNITMADIRLKRVSAIKKALAQGKSKYEFEVGYFVPVGE